MKKILSTISILAFGLFLSCNSDDDSNNNSNASDQLVNSKWLSEGGNCDIYYEFQKDTFTSINPCFGDDNQIELVSFESGVFSIENNELTLETNDSCNDNLIGKLDIVTFAIESDELTIENNEGALILTRVNTLPDIPESAEFGFFDFNNNGLWIRVDSCSLQ